ncbi:M48 family metalloprotease [Leptolyngbya ohadii]|uniref:M48 family metalloprotease n=1 Tax=Leptolyngbya ohadii TaxID=1962290 RepID=UPI000B59859B|nr:M48 family metalloprotease [Leptolyngbya ohadii]
MSNRAGDFYSGMSSPNPSANALQAGLLALKQKEYNRAIELLETVGQTASTRSDRLKAEMGLVKAYARTQQPQRAIALCQTLCRSQNSQVQNWATQTLSDLELRYESISTPGSAVPYWSDETGANLTGIGETGTDETGFMPLEDETGFIPSVLTSTAFSPPPTPATPAAKTESTPQPVLPEVQPSTKGSQVASVRVAADPEPLPNPVVSQPFDFSDWGTAQRLQKWSGLAKVDRSPFWALQVGTITFLVWWSCALINFGRDRLNEVLLNIRFDWIGLRLNYLAIYFDPFWAVVIGLAALFFASPWLLDRVLKSCYGMEDLRRTELDTFSPEALRLLRRLTGSRNLPFPTLQRIPIAVPFCVAYGYLPRNARIVVSQGLLEQLEPDEIAALLAAEWTHIAQREVGILSLAAIVAQLPYLLYWYAASWGNRISNRFLQALAIGLSSIGYGIYWLLRIPALLLSRIRVYFSDRTAAELTGNPNGLARALMKVTIGMAESLTADGSTPPLVESLDILMPVGYRQAIALGSFYKQNPVFDWMDWDCCRPYRPWLNALNSHPLLGDRLSRIADYARHWRLEPQITGQSIGQTPIANVKRNPGKARLYFAPVLGVLGGWLLAVLMWVIGFIAKQMNWLEIDWMWADWSVFTGLGLLGFSVGTFLRINAFFPDIKRTALREEPPLADWLTNPAALPIDHHPIRLQGQLYGRRGILNRLHQDLFLQINSPEGTIDRSMIRLHFTSPLGSFSDVILEMVRPEIWLGSPAKTVTVVGWFRRGAVPWIDVETIQSARGTIARSAHPVWSTVLGIVAAIAGAYVILTGGS